MQGYARLERVQGASRRGSARLKLSLDSSLAGSGADVVILPAFGVTIAAFEALRQIGCVLVDTTCGSVLNVWKRVESYARDGYTAIIHGKEWHEETKATASQVSMPSVHDQRTRYGKISPTMRRRETASSPTTPRPSCCTSA